MTTNNELINEYLKKNDCPFNNKLGVKVIEAEKGRVVIELKVNKDLSNNYGIIHGGVTASLCDTAMGAAVMTVGISPMTVEMKVNYLSPGGMEGKLVAKGNVVKKGRTLVIAESEVYYKDKLIAKSLGTYFAEHSSDNLV